MVNLDCKSISCRLSLECESLPMSSGFLHALFRPFYASLDGVDAHIRPFSYSAASLFPRDVSSAFACSFLPLSGISPLRLLGSPCSCAAATPRVRQMTFSSHSRRPHKSPASIGFHGRSPEWTDQRKCGNWRDSLGSLGPSLGRSSDKAPGTAASPSANSFFTRAKTQTQAFSVLWNLVSVSENLSRALSIGSRFSSSTWLLWDGGQAGMLALFYALGRPF